MRKGQGKFDGERILGCVLRVRDERATTMEAIVYTW